MDSPLDIGYRIPHLKGPWSTATDFVHQKDALEVVQVSDQNACYELPIILTLILIYY